MKKKLILASQPRGLLTGILIAVLGCSSCVSSKKFTDLQEKHLSLEQLQKDTDAEKKKLQASNLDLVQANDKLRSDNIALKSDVTELQRQYSDALKASDELNTKYEELLRSRDQDLGNLKEALRKLEKELVEKERSLEERETELASRDKESRALQEELEKLKRDLDIREKRVNELERKIRAKDSALLALKKQLSESLIGFENKGITVEQKNGKVYVSMESKLLFQSGRTEVDEEGRKALLQIAGALNKNTGFDIFIEGHTDNVPIKTARFEDNWDLSVLRSTSVLRILINEGKVNPVRIVPAGRGEFSPVAGNEEEAGRQKNRRIELILSPDLSEIYKLLE